MVRSTSERERRARVADDLREEYEERAAIMEYHGGMPRWAAEDRARRHVYGIGTERRRMDDSHATPQARADDSGTLCTGG